MVFVDTSFWIGLMHPRDARHRASVELLARYGDEPAVTTNHVCGETWTLLNRRVGHRLSVAFFDRIERTGRLSVAHVSAELERQAIDWLRRHDEREYSFVDATSFALMRSLGIREALAFDGDFAAVGFVELRP